MRRFDTESREGEDTEKRPAGAPSLREEDPELYGRLLLANEKIDNVGTDLIWVLAMGVIGLCVTIHMRWVHSLFGIDVDRVRGWGVYVLIVTIGFVGFSLYTSVREGFIYRSVRPDLLRYFHGHAISVFALLARMSDDKAVEEIAKKLKMDPAIQELGEGEGGYPGADP